MKTIVMRLQGRGTKFEFELSVSHGLIFSHPKKMKIKVKKAKKKDKKK